MKPTPSGASLFAPLTSHEANWHQEVTAKMRKSSAWLALIIPGLITVFMGWLDYISGWEVSLFIFYAIPIILAVWWSGSLGGILIAILSGFVWWLANEADHPYETHLGYAWALFNREFYFGVVVFAVNAVRNKQDADAARIRMLEERRQLEHDIVSVSEHEQQRIGQDLHDGLCQQLAAIGCAARVLADDLQAQGITAAHDAALIETSVQEAVLEARNLARGIFPVHVDRSGLSAALVDLAQSTSRLTSVEIEVRESAEVALDDPEVSMHLYRIAQEAVANALKHSGAKHVLIDLRLSPKELALRIEDDGSGIGLDSSRFTEGMGLRTMRYRAQTLGALLKITPRLCGGTIVSCQLPLDLHPSADHA